MLRRAAAPLGRVAVVALAALSLACGGTWDELEKANQAVKKNAPEEEAVAQEEVPKQGDEWWKSARSVTSDEKDPSLVTCKLDGRMQFMRRNDCLARGGRPS